MPTNDINQDRFQARLTKELRIKGSMPAPVLAPEIVPVLIVEGERPELLHLQREHRFCCTLTLGAVVNEYYYFQLNNPAGALGLVVVEEIGVTRGSGATSTVDFGFADAAVTASLAARDMYSLDSRIPGRNPNRAVAQALIGTDLAAGLMDVFGRFRTNGESMVIIRPNVVLTPGFGFGLWNSNVNEPIAGYCFWRERQAEVGELTRP